LLPFLEYMARNRPPSFFLKPLAFLLSGGRVFSPPRQFFFWATLQAPGRASLFFGGLFRSSKSWPFFFFFLLLGHFPFFLCEPGGFAAQEFGKLPFLRFRPPLLPQRRFAFFTALRKSPLFASSPPLLSSRMMLPFEPPSLPQRHPLPPEAKKKLSFFLKKSADVFHDLYQ